MVIRLTLVDIVAHAGVEDKVYALIEQVEYMSVRELSGVAYGVRGYGLLTAVVCIARGFV